MDSQLKLFEMDEEPLPGITAIHIPWHTRGSVAYAIKDGNSTLVHSGDSVTHEVLSIENPWVTFRSDLRPETGAAGRYEFLDMLAKERWQLLCVHAAFPGLMWVDHQGVNFQATADAYVASPTAASVCA